MSCSKDERSIRFFIVLLFLIVLPDANEALAAPLPNNVQRYKVNQPSYGFDFEVYRTNDTPDTWFRTYDGYFVTRRPDHNWVYGKLTNGSWIVNTDILVGSVNPATVGELAFPPNVQVARILNGPPVVVRPGKKPGDPPRVFDFYSPEPPFQQERAWDQIPWRIPPKEKMDFAERIYTTMKNALSSRRNAYMLYGEPLNIRRAWQPTSLFKEVPFPGDWGEHIIWTNDKRGILWWSKWHVFGINTYGSKVLGAWILDSGFGYNDSSIRMPHFWAWYDQRILLFSHFFQKKPVFDDEMAVWVLNQQYLFILVPHIGVSARDRGDMAKMATFLNPLEWIRQPFFLFSWIRWSLGWRPTNKHLLYYLVRLSEVPDEVTLNQMLRALRTPLKPGDIHEARDVENAEAAEKAQMRRQR